MMALHFPAKPLSISAANDDQAFSPVILLRPANDRIIPDIVA